MLANRSPSKQSQQQNSTTFQAKIVLPKTGSTTTTTTTTISTNFITNNGDENVKNVSENTSIFFIGNWTVADVVLWAHSIENISNEIINCLQNEKIDGRVLLALCENDIRDMRYHLNYQLPFGDLKKLWLAIHDLQQRHQHQNATTKSSNFNCSPTGTNGNNSLAINSHTPTHNNLDTTPIHHRRQHIFETAYCHSLENRETTTQQHTCGCLLLTSDYMNHIALTGGDNETLTPPMSVDGRAVNIPPDFFKTFISLGYSFLVTWITSFVMVIVHERVPDMKKYPPLPDIFLDNVPHIPWAFNMCEITGTLLFAIWSCVCIFHKYRMVLLRRFFALAGTVFLLRCVTMLITSLSVPGTHLQCDQNDYAVDDTDLTLTEALNLRISRAYTIWSGLGMSIQGVRTCGDYMFSGHTVALTLLNFFITEYTPRNLYFLHTLTWLLNMFGIFFILAAHEHYSIDVFVAFYITSRLFLYYHTLANNQALMSRDSTRTRIWFPMFSYFESSVDGIIPNEFDTISSLLDGLLRLLMEVKDTCMMTAQRFSVDPPQLALATKNLLLLPVSKKQQNVATSTQSTVTITNNGCQSSSSTDTIRADPLNANGSSVNKKIADAISKAKATTSTTNTILNHVNNNNNNNNSTIQERRSEENQRENNSNELNDENNSETKKLL